MNTQYKKGVLELCVPALLHKRDCYGYEISEFLSPQDLYLELYSGQILAESYRKALELIRRSEAGLGQPLLEKAPAVTGMDDEIPCCDLICQVALPYGMASWYFQDEMNDYRSQDYRGRYILALREAALCHGESVADCYGGSPSCRP